ncbi:spore germination protein GerW family protein [Halorhabdus amylolytica]|uniref:spore germination protein GerW family protein n=1 Tax=Halorhabdus amylolytica TaxID=2559573 RepID=UPI0010A9CE5A|nr:spore germination protein GerW family protein [Halorhabdus amylolytica]
MELHDAVTAAIETIRESAGVERVYGEAIERDGRTVVPVSRISYGFGGGFGQGSSNTENGDDENASTDNGSGGGGGGGVVAKPIGALEITDENTRFVRFDGRNRLLGAFVLGVAVGWVFQRVRE